MSDSMRRRLVTALAARTGGALAGALPGPAVLRHRRLLVRRDGRRRAAISRPSRLSSYAQSAGARWTAFANTLMLAPIGALLCLLVAYPVAYYLAVSVHPKHRLLLVSLIDRAVLDERFWCGPMRGCTCSASRGIPHLLGMIGIEASACSTRPARCCSGIVYAYLPLMIMPIYVSLEKLDRRLLEASADLGATPGTTFWRRDGAAVAARRHDRGRRW